MQGDFYQYDCYLNDLSTSLSGVYKIYPSRFALFIDGKLKNMPREDIQTSCNTTGDTRTEIRSSIYNSISYPFGSSLRPRKQVVDPFGTLVGVGDINFISSDIHDGEMMSEIFLQARPDCALRWRYMCDGISSPDHDIDRSIFTSEYRMADGTVRSFEDVEENPFLSGGDGGKFIEFDTIVIYYDIYKAGSPEPVAVDMPYGVYILSSPDRIEVQTDDLYGGGTTWATRLTTRFSGGAVRSAKEGITVSATDYDTLAETLTAFGDTMKTMDQMIGDRTTAIETIKAYLTEFRNERHVNVPYIVGDRWFVNGKDIGPMFPPEVLEQIKRG